MLGSGTGNRIQTSRAVEFDATVPGSIIKNAVVLLAFDASRTKGASVPFEGTSTIEAKTVRAVEPVVVPTKSTVPGMPPVVGPSRFPRGPKSASDTNKFARSSKP